MQHVRRTDTVKPVLQQYTAALGDFWQKKASFWWFTCKNSRKTRKGVSLVLHFKFQKKKHSRFKPKVLQTLNFRDPVSVRSGTDLKFRKSRIPVFGQNAVLFCKFARNGVLTFGKSLSCATFCGDSEFLIRKLLSPRIPELSPKNRIFWNEMREVT